MTAVPPAPSAWRREALRTNLWLVPTVEIVLAVALFAGTYALDRSAHHGSAQLPSWIFAGSADAGRTVVTAIAAAVITVVTLVFSITIVTLTLASTQFGPRMLRNFIRDRITQFTLGTFVATFVYAQRSCSHRSAPCARRVRAAPLGDGDDGPGGRGRARPRCLHRSHRQVDPAAAGDRVDSGRSLAGDRCRGASGARRCRGRRAAAEVTLRLAEDSGGRLRWLRSGDLQCVRVDAPCVIAPATMRSSAFCTDPVTSSSRASRSRSVSPVSADAGVAGALGGATRPCCIALIMQDLSFAVDPDRGDRDPGMVPAVNEPSPPWRASTGWRYSPAVLGDAHPRAHHEHRRTRSPGCGWGTATAIPPRSSASARAATPSTSPRVMIVPSLFVSLGALGATARSPARAGSWG